MKKYGERFGADSTAGVSDRFQKLRSPGLAGEQLEIERRPVKPEERKNDATGSSHSTIFVVVDKHARLRGTFETQGDGVDWTNVQPRLIPPCVNRTARNDPAQTLAIAGVLFRKSPSPGSRRAGPPLPAKRGEGNGRGVV